MTTRVKNILFIMCDQLRQDYLGCYGHPTIKTPNIDALAARGVKFDRAYVQSPMCGPARASFYTGRYVSSHGVPWNGVPLPVGEQTLGDYLRPHGIRTALAGKTHAAADEEGIARFGIPLDSEQGILLAESGFEPYARHDGLYAKQRQIELDKSPYKKYLNDLGYEGENPWHDFANSAEGDNGEILSGWQMRHAHLPARIKEEHSETPWVTNRAIDFITEQGEQPWCLHLSYIKPHWPYIAPAPYHDMYSAADVLPAKRTPAEWDDPHPVAAVFREHLEGQSFAREEVRERVIPTYMGLITQIDDHLGRLFNFLKQTGRDHDTLIIFTSDHGDYLGDHWLGEKELCHDVSSLIPLIIVDPRQEADKTRGTTELALTEGIDVLPTILDAAGIPIPDHILEGRSLQDLLHGSPVDQWRDAAFAEFDYSLQYPARRKLERDIDSCWLYMVRTEQYKYLWYDGFRPQLFDLQNDPAEQNDLAAKPEYQQVIAEHQQRLFDWLRKRKRRVTMSDEKLDKRAKANPYGEPDTKSGILIGVW